MKRDIELIKLILEHFENKADWKVEKDLEINGYERQLVSYHVDIMYEAGLINGEVLSSINGRIYDVLPFRLTWAGHEFLDNIRDKSRWNKIKEILKDKGGSFSFELIKTLASKIAEQQLLGG